jgi:hypothetical protein
MAVDPHAVQITREHVAEWLGEFTGTTEEELRTFLEQKLGANAGLMIDTRDMNIWTEYTNVVDMILEDLPSYGFSYGD